MYSAELLFVGTLILYLYSLLHLSSQGILYQEYSEARKSWETERDRLLHDNRQLASYREQDQVQVQQLKVHLTLTMPIHCALTLVDPHRAYTLYTHPICHLCFCSVVVITCASHAQGPRFDPEQKQFLFFFLSCLTNGFCLGPNVTLCVHPTCSWADMSL